MQLQLFDPRMTPTATSEMLADAEIAAPAIEPLKPADKRIYKMVAVKDWGKNQPVMVDNIACGRRPKRKVKEKT